MSPRQDKPKRIATIVGARPQFIKSAVLSRLLRTGAGSLREILIHTGQHYSENMSAIFFEEMEIEAPHYSLGVGPGDQGAQTGKMLAAIEEVLLKEKPDAVLVYGDTNSTLAGALAAAKCHIPLFHVEAGLRSFNKKMPEEINRILTDHCSTLLFAPTHTAVAHLTREGFSPSSIHLVGDVMYDAVLHYEKRSCEQSQILHTLQLKENSYVLATLHRAENTDDPLCLRAILKGLDRVASRIPVVLPMHPRTQKKIAESGAAISPRIQVTSPVGYLDMIALERNAALIATDSGGVQKEAFFFEKPCVTLRAETEWTELVELGWNKIVPPALGGVAEGILSALGTRGKTATPYGDGKCAQRVQSIIENYLSNEI